MHFEATLAERVCEYCFRPHPIGNKMGSDPRIIAAATALMNPQPSQLRGRDIYISNKHSHLDLAKVSDAVKIRGQRSQVIWLFGGHQGLDTTGAALTKD